MIRFETKPNVLASAGVTWGPWRQPTCLVSVYAIFTAAAIAATRVPRIEVRNVITPMQSFHPSGPYVTSALASAIRTITALHGAGGSNIFGPTGVEVQEGYWQIALPQWLVVPPSYVVKLQLTGEDPADTLTNIVAGFEDVLEFRG